MSIWKHKKILYSDNDSDPNIDNNSDSDSDSDSDNDNDNDSDDDSEENYGLDEDMTSEEDEGTTSEEDEGTTSEEDDGATSEEFEDDDYDNILDKSVRIVRRQDDLNIGTKSQSDFKKYVDKMKIENNTGQAKVILDFINYKLVVTNAMLNNFLMKLPVRIFIPKAIMSGRKMKNEKWLLIIFNLLIDNLNKPIDNNIIKKYLPAILQNLTINNELIARFGLTLDDVYYACYLTNTMDEYESLFVGIKYEFRRLAKTGTVAQYNKFAKTNKLEPDNYCYEFSSLHNTRVNRALKDIYVPTIRAMQNRRAIGYTTFADLQVLVDHHQTKEYMEQICSKIKK
jgi:hypothetical protein